MENVKKLPYINDEGYEVPDNKILVVPNNDGDGFYKEIIDPLKGKVKRDWFNEHFYYCLPVNIGNQYGYVIRSLRDFDMVWDGSNNKSDDVSFTFLNEDNSDKQTIKSGFSTGVVTIQNRFALKTPPGVNIMTIQPPNMFIPGCVAMTAVVETDQIRRDFTFNIKITIPNFKISVRKGDALGAFIPVQRYFVDKFDIDLASNHFEKHLIDNELKELYDLSIERNNLDILKPHQSGRRYFNGKHSDDSKYKDHQKRVV
jgi:hypothetical protein